jgi:hypothetical protein
LEVNAKRKDYRIIGGMRRNMLRSYKSTNGLPSKSRPSAKAPKVRNSFHCGTSIKYLHFMKVQNILASSMRVIPPNLEACANFTNVKYKRKILVNYTSTLTTSRH